MPFSALIGNDRIKELLKRAVNDGRIGHALIMAGPRGVGKYRFALALAQAVNCDDPRAGDACGGCAPCKKVAADEHADVQTIKPDGSFIKIGQMRDMAREAQYRPYEGRRRVLIIDDADRLREVAANSILKTLEEPPDTSLIVLVSAKPYALLQTVRSRCQMINFAPLTAEQIESHLASDAKRSRDEVRLISRLARGSIGRALEIDLSAYRDRRRVMLEVLDALAVNRDVVRLMQAAEYLSRKLEREEFEEHLETLATLLSDLLRLKLSESADSITNSDVLDRLRRLGENTTIQQITEWADKIEQLWQGLDRNINRQLATEALLIAG